MATGFNSLAGLGANSSEKDRRDLPVFKVGKEKDGRRVDVRFSCAGGEERKEILQSSCCWFLSVRLKSNFAAVQVNKLHKLHKREACPNAYDAKKQELQSFFTLFGWMAGRLS